MSVKYLDYDGLEEVVEQIDAKYAKISQLPTVNNGTLTINKNGALAGTFTANQSSNTTIDLTIPTTASDVGALPSSTKYGASISLSINSTTYVITAQLKDQDGNNLGTAQTIDLPLESVVVSGSYDAQTKKIILTLQNGSTIEFSVADLVSGLQTEITAQNKLSADLVDDTSTTNKFVTASDKTNWNGKQDALVSGTNIKTINSTSLLGSGNISIHDITELSTEYIRITDLDTGVYKCTYTSGAIKIYYSGSTDTLATNLTFTGYLGEVLLFVTKTNNVWSWYAITTPALATGYSPFLKFGKTTTTAGESQGRYLSSIPVSIVNNLNWTTNDNSDALSAYQGYVLKQEIDTLPDTAITIAEIDALFS